MKAHWESNGRVWVNQECIKECWEKIQPWLDISVLYSHLVSHHIANSDEDYHNLIGGNYAPSKVKHHLLHKLIPAMSYYGPYLFYMCLLKSGSLGHSSAASELKRVGE